MPEPFRREVYRDPDDQTDAMRVRPPRDMEDVQAYADRLSAWINLIISAHTTAWPEGERFTEERADQMDREMKAMPRPAQVVLNRLFRQRDVLAWVLNNNEDDLINHTRTAVDNVVPPNALYELEEAYRPAPCFHPGAGLLEREDGDFLCDDCNEIVPRADAERIRATTTDDEMNWRPE